MTEPRLAPVVLGGAAAGALDIAYAIVFWWFRNRVPPVRILQSVAAGLLGRPAYAGGLPTAILGLALHFLIALCAAAVFSLAAGSWPLLRRRPLASGAVYGLLVWVVARRGPLSRFPPRASIALDVL